MNLPQARNQTADENTLSQPAGPAAVPLQGCGGVAVAILTRRGPGGGPTTRLRC